MSRVTLTAPSSPGAGAGGGSSAVAPTGVFREVPLCRFDDLSWQDYKVAGRTTCDVQPAATRISASGIGDWACGFAYSQRVGSRFIVCRVDASRGVVELVEWSLDCDLFGNAVRLHFPAAIAPGAAAVRVFEDRVQDAKRGTLRCICVAVVTCGGTIHRVVFPHATSLAGPGVGGDGSDEDMDGGSGAVRPSVFARFADDDETVVAPLQPASSSSSSSSTTGSTPPGDVSGGRTACLRAEHVSLDLRRMACVTTAAWVSGDKVAVGSSSGAVVVVELPALASQPASAVTGVVEIAVTARYELFNAGIVSKLWGGLVGSSTSSAVVGMSGVTTSDGAHTYVLVAHAHGHLSIWHANSRRCLLDTPLNDCCGSDAVVDETLGEVLAATITATQVVSNGSRGHAVYVVVQTLQRLIGGDSDATDVAGAKQDQDGGDGVHASPAVLLDCRLSPTTATARPRKRAGACFLGGTYHPTPMAAQNMRRLVASMPAAQGSWALWRGAPTASSPQGSGPGCIVRHEEFAPGAPASDAVRSRVVLPLRVEQARLAAVDAGGASSSLEFGDGLREEEKFHVSRVFARGRFAPSVVAAAVAAFAAHTDSLSLTSVGVSSSAGSTAARTRQRTFMAASAQRRQQLVIEAVRARMDVDLKPWRERLRNGDAGDVSMASAAEDDEDDEDERQLTAKQEVQIARRAWQHFLDVCRCMWARDMLPLGLILATRRRRRGSAAAPAVAAPLVIRRGGVALLREVAPVEAVTLDCATGFRRTDYAPRPARHIDVSSLFDSESKGTDATRVAEGEEERVLLADGDDALGVLWAATALGALLPAHVRDRLDNAGWSSGLSTAAMKALALQAADHLDSSIIVAAELSGSAAGDGEGEATEGSAAAPSGAFRLTPSQVPAYAGPWGGVLVDGSAGAGFDVGVSLAIMHAVAKRMAKVRDLSMALQRAAAMVNACPRYLRGRAASKQLAQGEPATLRLPAALRGSPSAASFDRLRSSTLAPRMVTAAALQHAAAMRCAARDMAVLLALCARGHRVVGGAAAVGVGEDATLRWQLLAQVVESCGRLRCVEWMGSRLVSEVGVASGTSAAGGGGGVPGFEMVLGGGSLGSGVTGAGISASPAPATTGDDSSSVGIGVRAAAPAPKFALGAESIAQYLRKTMHQVLLQPVGNGASTGSPLRTASGRVPPSLVRLPSGVPFAFQDDANDRRRARQRAAGAGAGAGAAAAAAKAASSSRSAFVHRVAPYTPLLAAMFAHSTQSVWKVAQLLHELREEDVSVVHHPACLPAVAAALVNLVCYEPNAVDVQLPGPRVSPLTGRTSLPWPTFTLLSAPAQFLQLTGQHAHLQALCELRLAEAVDPADAAAPVIAPTTPSTPRHPEDGTDALSARQRIVERLLAQQRRQYRVALAGCELLQARMFAVAGLAGDALEWRKEAVHHLLQAAPPSLLFDASAGNDDSDDGDDEMTADGESKGTVGEAAGGVKNNRAVVDAVLRGVASYHLSAVALLDHHGLSGMTMPFLNAALGCIAKMRGANPLLLASVWSKVFNVALECSDFDTCCTAVLRTTQQQWSDEFLQRLVGAMCRRGHVRQLLSFPLDNRRWRVVEAHLAHLANTTPVTLAADVSAVEGGDGSASEPNFYRILYALHVRTQSYAKAASVMWSLAQRVAATPAGTSLAALKVRVDALSAAANTLSLLKPDLAYIITKPHRARGSGSGSSTPAATTATGSKRKRTGAALYADDATAGAGDDAAQLLSMHDVRLALALASAQLDIARGNAVADPDIVHNTSTHAGWRSVPTSSEDILEMLLSQGRFERAMSLARLAEPPGAYSYTQSGVGDGTRGTLVATGLPGVSTERVVAALARACVMLQGTDSASQEQQQQQSLPPLYASMHMDDTDDLAAFFGSEGDGSDGQSSAVVGRHRHGGREWYETGDGGMATADDVGGKRGAGGDGSLGHGGVGGNLSRAARAWRLLQDYLWRYDGPRTGFTLAKVALRTVLTARASLVPPPWLLRCLRGPAQVWDVQPTGVQDRQVTGLPSVDRTVGGVGGGDVAALLRILIETGRLGLATRIACSLMPPVPAASRDLQRCDIPPSGEWLPYQALDELLFALNAVKDRHADDDVLRVWVPELVRRLKRHAESRWPVAEELAAHLAGLARHDDDRETMRRQGPRAVLPPPAARPVEEDGSDSDVELVAEEEYKGSVPVANPFASSAASEQASAPESPATNPFAQGPAAAADPFAAAPAAAATPPSANPFAVPAPAPASGGNPFASFGGGGDGDTLTPLQTNMTIGSFAGPASAAPVGDVAPAADAASAPSPAGDSNPFAQAAPATDSNPFAAPATDGPFAEAPAMPTDNPPAQPEAPADNPFAQTAAAAANPFAQPEAAAANPFAQPEAAAANPFAQPEAPASNPFAQPEAPADNPFAQTEAPADNPFAQTEAPADNPFAPTEAPASNPFAQTEAPASNPFAQ